MNKYNENIIKGKIIKIKGHIAQAAFIQPERYVQYALSCKKI
jgi:hypothetical protein